MLAGLFKVNLKCAKSQAILVKCLEDSTTKKWLQGNLIRAVNLMFLSIMWNRNDYLSFQNKNVNMNLVFTGCWIDSPGDQSCLNRTKSGSSSLVQLP